MKTLRTPSSTFSKFTIPCLAMLIAAANTSATEIFVSDATGLNSAINTANGAVSGTVTIHLTSGFTLNGAVTAIDINTNVNLVINGGNGATINGSGNNGLVVMDGKVTLSNVAIVNATAQGGYGSDAGGGGAGMGGAIFVGSTADVTLNNVSFGNNAAKGGDGGNMALLEVLAGGGAGGASFNDAANHPSESMGLLVGGDGGGLNGGAGGGLLTAGGNGGAGGGGGGGGLDLLGLTGAAGGNGGFGGGGGSAAGVGILSTLGASGGNGGFGGGGGGGGLNILGLSNSGNVGVAGFGGGNAYTGPLLGVYSAGGGGAGMGGNVFVMNGGKITVSGSATQALGTVTGGNGGGGSATAGSAYGANMFLQGTGTIYYGTVTDTASDTITLHGGIADEAGSGGNTANRWNLTKVGAGKLIVAGDNTYQGVTTVEAGTLQIGDGGTAGSIAGDIVNSGVVSFNRSDDITYGHIISGTGSVSQDGTGTTTLSGANTYSGPTQVNAGVLQAGAGGAFSPNSAFTIATGATLDLNDFNQTVGSIAGSGAIDLGTATLTAGGNNSDTTFAGIISGTGALIKTGAGDLTLTGANTYSGGTTINNGRIIGTTTSLQGPFTSSTGTELVFDQNFDGTFNGTYDGAGTLVKTGSGAVTLTGPNGYTGGTAINGGKLIVEHVDALGTGGVNVDGATLTANVALRIPGTIILQNGARWDGTGSLNADLFDVRDGTATVALVGAGTMEKTTSGTVTISGNNTYLGGTIVSAGTLIATSATALGTGIVDVDGGTLRADTAVTVGNTLILQNNGRWEGPGSLSAPFFDVRDGIATVNLTGSGYLVKSTAGLVTLSGVNNYVGTTSVTGGTLKLVGVGALAGDVSLATGTMLLIENAADETLSHNVTGAGNLTKTGAGTLTITSAGAITGTTSAEQGTLVINSAAAISPGAYAVNSGAEIEFKAHNGTFGSDLSGDGTYRFSGAGITTIGGATSGNAEIIVDNGHTVNLGGTANAPTNLGYSVRVLAGGELRGNANLLHLTNAGRLNIGNSVGTVVVAGNFVNSGVLDIEIAGTGTGQYDVVQYAGSATIQSGSTLNISFISGYTPAAGDSVLFLEDSNIGSGTFTGSFTTENLPTLPAGLLSSILVNARGMAFTVYSATLPADLRVRRGTENFVAQVPNNAAGYAAIAANGVTNGNAWMTAALTSASPIGLSSMEALVIDESRANTKFLMGRSRSELANRWGDLEEWTAFADIHGAYTDWKEDLYEGGTFNQHFFGGKAGLSTRLTHELAFGAFMGYDNGHASLHNGAGKVSQNRGSLGAYLSYAPGDDAFIFGAITGGISSFDTKRNTVTGEQSGDANGYDISAAFGFGKTFRISKSFDTTSFVDLTYTWINTDAINETGSAFAANIASRDNDSLRARAGQEVAYTLPVDGGALRFSLGVAFEHECLKDDAKIKGSFANGAGDFTVHGDTLSRNSVVVTPGLAWQFAPNQAVSATYSYEHGFSKMHSNRFDIAYRFGF